MHLSDLWNWFFCPSKIKGLLGLTFELQRKNKGNCPLKGDQKGRHLTIQSFVEGRVWYGMIMFAYKIRLKPSVESAKQSKAFLCFSLKPVYSRLGRKTSKLAAKARPNVLAQYIQSPMRPYTDYGKSMPTRHCGLTCNLMTQLLK